MRDRKTRLLKWTGVILVMSLVLSVIYALVRVVQAPAEIPEGATYTKTKSDYLLMLVQCLLGLIVSLLPSMLARRWKIILPNTIYILYFAFLYCAIYLGEVWDFFYRVPHWDTLLHAFSGAMLGALGFVLVDLLNRSEQVRVSLSPFFVALFAFCFALAVGALWEVYEFSMDGALGLNMQKHTTQQGAALLSHAAVADTMKDVIIDALSALGVSVLGYYALKNRREAAVLEAPLSDE